jgi:hypothetical protein
MKNLQARQQTLINLITRVGGKQNIQKWMDELLKIDWKLESTEVKQMETTYKGYELVEIDSDREPGVYKNGSLLTEGKYFEVESSYDSEGVILLDKDGKEFPFNIELPALTAAQKTEYATRLETQKAIEFSIAAGEWKQVFQEVFVAQTGTTTKVISFWRHPVYSEREALKLLGVEIADNWKASQQLINRDQKVFQNWVEHWELKATKAVPKHPLASKKAAYPDLKEYFYSLYPELREYESYINICMWPVANAVFECRKGAVSYEQLSDGVDKYIYKFDEDKKVDAIVISTQEALERAKAFKTYADAKSAEGLAREEAKKAQQQKERDYETYKKTQQAKKGIIKPFEKWLATV